MKYLKILFVIIIAFLILPLIMTAPAQESDQKLAEVSIYPSGAMPVIESNKETNISLIYKDNFGMNWTKLQHINGAVGIGGIISFIRTRIIWPILHPAWRPMLGYSSITLSTEILGTPQGWVASVNPTTIAGSTDGTIAHLNLRVYVTDIAVNNTVMVRISATRYNKDGTEYGTSYFDIPVRSAKLNFLEIRPNENIKETSPDSMVQFTIDVTNLGYFIDTFSMKVDTKDNIKAVLSDQSFVIQSGETRTLTLWVMTPETFFDPGTPHSINITAYSLKYPEKSFYGSVTVITKGFYASPLIIIPLIVIIIFILLIYFLLFYLRDKHEKERLGKPEKPWKIPEEKAYLLNLKQNDKKAYAQERQMMKDEYKSALLWYRDYRQEMKQKPIEEEPAQKDTISKKLSAFLKKPEKKSVQKEKPKKKLPVLLKKSAEKPKEKVVKPIVPVEDTRKEEAIAKIQREQDKQLRKMNR